MAKGNGGLTLGLAVGRSIHIGRGIRVTLLRIEDGEAKLYFEAPRSVAISRDAYTLEQHLEFQRRREQVA